ncbi:hypothetical protein BH11PSE2_BH11PSE2_06390 [soil metagenome]
MPGLNDNQLSVIRALIDTSPDSAIRSLDAALQSVHGDGPMATIRDMVSAEAGERRARAMTFGPLIKLCPRATPVVEFDRFPAKIPAMLWCALKAEVELKVIAGMAASAGWRDEEADSTAFDDLCAVAAAGLRSPGETAFAAPFQVLEEAKTGSAERLALYLDLVPLARRTLNFVPDWLGRMTEERAASVRIAFRDAGEIGPDGGGPRLLDLIQAQMEEPWQILRIVSAVMDRPSDTYIAGSELSHIGQRILDAIDRRLDDLRAFEPHKGAPAGVAAAEAAHIAVLAICEFDQSLELKRDGPWGSQIARQKRDLAQSVEGRFAKTDEAVGAALPLKSVRYAGRMVRGMPQLTSDPDPRMVTKAEGFLAFLDKSRNSAPTGGYASLRNKIVEKLDARLDAYSEDLIETLRTDEAALHERARLYLELTATFMGFVRDEKAAQIVRRRAAA